ncbi:DUF2075 domain-containing protein [Acidiferrimicrobium sp. IK]|uniref:DUF2075 domain-containing protein n=1 Tax=Acidiferrimicrobium sp. IK TaxID=2871700 RepID=UPI0021CB7AD6|nr:DUF2075 domain-containing protein [Acidiferrimicrobium sp. IK]MCU4187214.1 DUF2075 domain-containing protein [Acidiferrimicrobium sp. IK]
MQLYRGTTDAFRRDALSGALTEATTEHFLGVFGYPPSQSEANSWIRRIPALAALLVDAGLDQVELLAEYQLPLTSKRIVALCGGRNPSGGISAVVVENEQWANGEIEDIDTRRATLLRRSLLRPQQQVVQHLEDFNQLHEQGSLTISGAVLLHNATKHDVAEYPMFTADTFGAARTLLADRRLSPASLGAVCDEFLAGRIRAAKKLMDHVAEQIKGHDTLTLLDEQLVAYDLVSQAVAESRRNSKTIVLGKSGPDTDKSVLTTTVLADLSKAGYNCSRAAGSKAFTLTLRSRVRDRAVQIFRYFNNFGSASPKELDCLIADEVHCIGLTSNSRFTPKAERSNLAQVDELIRVAGVPVLLLDERQIVRPRETGTSDVIGEAGDRNGIDLIEIDLNGQFRSGGSQAYIDGADALLDLTDTRAQPWTDDHAFEVTVVDSPKEMDAWVRAQNSRGHTARIAAGVCWRWSDPTQDGTLIDDTTIGRWTRPWNAKPVKKAHGAPPAELWARDPRGLERLGCVYTAQGFEYDYAGVILGEDLLWRDDRWEGHPENSADTVVKRRVNFTELIRHTYNSANDKRA